MKELSKEKRREFRKVFGAVGWPGKRPGFALILGQKKEFRMCGYDVELLDEFEEVDTQRLVRGAGGLDFIYKPDVWIGESKNSAADQFIREMNKETDSRQACLEGRRNLKPRRSRLMDMENVFEYCLPVLKEMLQKDKRRLFLPEGKLRNYLAQVEAADLTIIRPGDFPAIEAVMYGVLELEEAGKERKPREQYAKNNFGKIGVRYG